MHVRPVTRGGCPPAKMFAPLEKCVGHSLKLLAIVEKIWPPLKAHFAPIVSQAGYGPATRTSSTYDDFQMSCNVI